MTWSRIEEDLRFRLARHVDLRGGKELDEVVGSCGHALGQAHEIRVREGNAYVSAAIAAASAMKPEECEPGSHLGLSASRQALAVDGDELVRIHSAPTSGT